MQEELWEIIIFHTPNNIILMWEMLKKKLMGWKKDEITRERKTETEKYLRTLSVIHLGIV